MPEDRALDWGARLCVVKWNERPLAAPTPRGERDVLRFEPLPKFGKVLKVLAQQQKQKAVLELGSDGDRVFVVTTKSRVRSRAPVEARYKQVAVGLDARAHAAARR